MEQIITSIKIDKRIRDAGKIQATKQGITFSAFYEEAILEKIRDKNPELFQELCEGKSLFKKEEEQLTPLRLEIRKKIKKDEIRKLPSGMEDLGQVIIEDEGAF